MTKRLKVYLLIVFAAASILCALAGCKVGEPGLSELLAGYDGKVTYYSNGGRFNDSTTMSVMEIYYKAGADGVPFFNVTSSTLDMKVDRRGYDLMGWYEPARYTEDDGEKYSEYVGDIKFEITYTPDAEGNISDKIVTGNTVTEYVFPVKNAKGEIITDFENDRPVYARMNADGTLKDERITEERITVVCDEEKLVAGYNENEELVNNLTVDRNTEIDVCAKWELSASISYHLIVTDETGKILSDEEGKDPTYYDVTELDKDDNEKVIASYKNGDEIILRPIVGESATPLDMELVSIKGLSFVRTYMDDKLTERVREVARPTGDEDIIINVYCRYIVGNWNVVSASSSSSQQAGQIRRMFNGLWNAQNNYLILDDIDCSNFAPLSLKVGGDNTAFARANIVTDGTAPKTLSNLKFEISGTVGNGYTYSILGVIDEQFKIKGGGLILQDIGITIPTTSREFNFYAICTAANSAAAANVKLTVDTVTVTYQCSADKINNGNLDGDSWLLGGNASQFTGITVTGTNTISPYQQTQS